MGACNLPPQPTPFIGRAEELAELGRLLEDPACRLLTLVGPGGVGKTRLALEAARQQADRFPDGVYFVPLQALGAAGHILPALAEAVDFPFREGGDPKLQLLNYLRAKRLLLLLDNFEHLLDGVGLVSDVLRAAPDVKALATSRAVLNLVEEWVYPVPGMTYPGEVVLEALDMYSAVQLFADRARRVQGDFTLAAQGPSVTRICRLVEGMPLALELAASWLHTLTCAAIGDEIARGLDLLATSLRNVPERHRSMRAVFDHSWGLLTEEEQAVFMWLSVFRGGCTREAAAAVAGATLYTLSRLVAQSLLRRDEAGRFHVHELLRQYAAERLEAVGETRAARDAHGAYFAAFMTEREIDIKGRAQRVGLDAVEADFQNLCAAWEWAVAQRDEAAIDRMLEGVYWFCGIRGRTPEGKAMFRRAEARLAPGAGEVPTLTWGRLLARYADSAEGLKARAGTALRIAHHYEDEAAIAFATWQSGIYFWWQERCVEAIPFLERSLAQYQALGDVFHAGRVMFDLGYCRGVGVGYQEQLQTVQAGIELCRANGDISTLAYFLVHLSALDMYHGDYVEAERCRRELLDMWLGIDNRADLSMGKVALADALFWQGKLAESKALSEEALALTRTYQDPEYEAFALTYLSRVESTEERYGDGWEYAQRAFSAYARNPVLQFYAHLSAALAVCGLGDFAAARGHLHTALSIMPADLQMAGTLTICLPTFALILAHEGGPVRAAEVLGLAFSHPVGPVGWMAQWPLLTRLRANLEAELGPDAYAAAWERGAALDLKSAVADFLDSAQPGAPTPQQDANAALVEPLSARELEVLALLAEQRSNREIASRLVVALGTVKTHVHNICQKLGVSDRLQAIARARDLKLL